MDTIMKFDDDVKNATKIYHRINNIFFGLSIIGGYLVAASYSTIEVAYKSEVDPLLFLAIFSAILLTYTLLYVFIRVTINAYGEKYRANLYNQLIYSKLWSMQNK